MPHLFLKALAGLSNLVFWLGVALFLPAWTFHYWQAWVFVGVFTSCVLAITIDLMKRDPALLERRMQVGPTAEKRTSQKILQSFASLAFLALFIVPSLDHRFGWSSVSVYVVGAGDLLVVLGLYAVLLVFKANTFTSATIEVRPEQRIVSTGPYAIVRHPMYAGALVMLVGIPLALGSWWGLLGVVPMTLVLALRLLDEEKVLGTELAGYAEYREKVRYRLVPGVW